MPVIYGEALPTRAATNHAALPQAEKRNHLPFLLMIHPDRWTWDPVEADWLIELGRLPLSGGVGGVGIDPNGREFAHLAIAERQAKGWVVLQDGDPRLAAPAFGLPGGKYLARHPANPHGYAHSFMWEGYERVRTSIEWGEDRPRRIAFQRAIEAAQLVPTMSPKLMDLDIRDVTRRVRGLGDKRSKNPEHVSIRIRLEDAEKMQKAMELAREKRIHPNDFVKALEEEPVKDREPKGKGK